MNFWPCKQFLIVLFGEIIFSPCSSVPLAYKVENFQEGKYGKILPVLSFHGKKWFMTSACPLKWCISSHSSHLLGTAPSVRVWAPFYRQLWRSPSFCVPIIGSSHVQLCLLSLVGGYYGLDLYKKWTEAWLWLHIKLH